MGMLVDWDILMKGSIKISNFTWIVIDGRPTSDYSWISSDKLNVTLFFPPLVFQIFL